MKRFTLMLVLLMIMPFSTVFAINLDGEGPHILAKMMPASTEMFGATRIGEDFIAELDAITTAVYDKLPESFEIEPYTLNSTMRTMLAEEGQDWDRWMEILGDHAAIGIEPVDGFNSGEDPIGTVIIEITDQTGAEELFLELTDDSSDVPERQVDGDNIVYISEREPLKLMFTPTHVILTNNIEYTPNVDPPLSSSANFTGALNMLNADQYNTLGFISEAAVEAMLSEGDMEDLQMLGLNPADAGAIAVGFTILDGRTFTMDIAVQTASPVPESTVSVDFLNAMPSTTDAFVVASDLTNMYNSIVAAVRAAALANGEDDPTVQIPLMFNFTGLDLEEDVLSWTTGGYGVFMGADYMALIDEAMSTGTLSELNIDAGIVIEATDVALAQNAATEFGNFITLALANEEDVTVTQEDIDGVTVTSIVGQGQFDSSSPPIELEFVLTATEQFFFFGTRSALDTIMRGDTLANNADFGASTGYFLDNPTSVWYLSSEGVVSSTIVPLALLGPAIGNVFDNIVDELGGTTESAPSNNSGGSAMMDDMGMMVELMDVYNEILSSMTLTTSIDAGGVIRVRGTMSFNP